MLDAILTQDEEDAVHYDLGLASTFRDLLERLKENPTVDAAFSGLLLPPLPACSYLARAQSLYEEPVDPQYLHPNDLVLCAYIYILRHHWDEDIRNFIRQVARDERAGFRWAPRLTGLYADYQATFFVVPSNGIGGQPPNIQLQAPEYYILA